MALPPWLVSFDTSGALFANEQPAPGVAGFLQLMAEGPRTAEPQPAAGQSLDLWLTRRVDPSGGAAWPARLIDLPSGSGVLIEQVVRADRPRVWRVAAYAVRTRAGVAYLLIDGPPGSWAGREADAALIPMLMELGPGS